MLKNMLCLLLAGALLVGATACGDKSASSSASSSSGSSSSAEGGEGAVGREIALITDIGTVDDESFNQGTWEGVVKYAEEKGISHQFYQPMEQTTAAYLEAIDLAVGGGAKIIVTPGFLFEEAVYTAQTKYPDTQFILIDGRPNDGAQSGPVYKTESNTYAVSYAEEQAGFLAGYAAVMDGNKRLGFMGGIAAPPVVRYGYGFIQGAEYAAKEQGLAPGTVEVKYTYVGSFDATPENQTLAASWFQGGTEVVFGCGGSVGSSVMAAAQLMEGKKTIGVDTDQSGLSPSVLTSATKDLQGTVYSALAASYSGKFPGGQEVTLGAEANAVNLAMDASRFASFAKADYEKIYAKLAAGEVKVLKDDAAPTPDKLAVELVKVTLI